MTGLNRHTGGAIDGDAQLAQDIGDLLSTPVGSRLTNREYGAEITTLIDRPQNAETALLLCAAAAKAINRWFASRLKITRCTPAFDASGAGALVLVGYRPDQPQNQPFTLTLPI